MSNLDYYDVSPAQLRIDMESWGQAGKPLADKLRKVATAEIETYEFSPKDWRPNAIPLLLCQAADEIEYLLNLRSAAG